jgi:DNA uptake protein ComE-like DNA-binding protein
MKRWLLLFVCLLPVLVFAQLVDLNTATLAELKQLPITEKQAQDIYSYREYISFFGSIFDLRAIDSIDQPTLNKLRPLVSVSLYRETDDVTQRREEIMDMLDRYDSNEGGSEGMADVWMDYLMTPQNINTMHFDDLISLPNLSAIDAAAILYRRARGDTIADMRDLRNTLGLSHYGYTNLRSFVYYREPPVKNRLYIDAQIQYYTRYLEEGVYDMMKEAIIRNKAGNSSPVIVPHDKRLSYYGYFKMDEVNPDVMLKTRIRYGNKIKSGWMYYSSKAETATDFSVLGKNSTAEERDKLFKDSKLYVGYENPELNLPGNSSLKVYLGNYRATYGEGLVMENTDFYSARKTGYGFGKRIMGITPDLSRTQEYALRGGAMEYRNKWFGASLFFSHDKKDAMVYMERDSVETSPGVYQYLKSTHPQKDANGKYNVLSYVTPAVRFDNDELSQAETYFNTELPMGDAYTVPYMNLAPRMDIMDEKLWGTHLQVTPIIGTKLGFTTYTALYDNVNFVAPKGDALRNLIIRDSYDYTKFKYNDSEISAFYSTKTSTYERDFRRVMGFDWMTVLGNSSLQGEYAELTVNGKDSKLNDDPNAYIISAYTQFENLYFLTLYRNIDLEFDNPYSNAFAEHARFDDTILDKNIYTLTNPLLSDLWQSSSQAQPEKGVYFETRYKFNTYYTIGRSYLDIWERMSDHRRSARFQSELEFRPLYQLGLRARYKNQINRYDDFADRAVSKTNEYTLSTRAFLSNRDFLEFEYRYNTVWGPPYVSLTNPAQAGNNTIVGSMVLMKGDFIGVNYTHHFNKNFYMQGSFLYWYGHGISHWDWEDMEIDFMGNKGCKSWIAFHSRISQNMFMSLKYRNKTYQDLELRLRKYNEAFPATQDNYFQNVQHSENTIRLQIDYRF